MIYLYCDQSCNVEDYPEAIVIMSNLYEAFQEYFEVIIVDTPELLEEVYRIRYQVLCIEKRLPGFEKSLYSDGLEKDSYDSHSSHVLLKYRPTGDFIGTVRLILFDPLNPEKLLPIEIHAELDHKLCDIGKLKRQQTAEVSRFVIIGNFSRRKSERRNLETRKEDTSKTKSDRRATPHLALVLAAGVVRMCAKSDVRNWLSVMDPSLNRLLSHFGLDLNPIGPMVDYHGLRQPYFIKIADALNKMEKKHRDAWEVVTEKGKYSHFLSD